MNLLILGGTVFLGRHLTEVALEGGHRVTHFNRGKSNVDLFPEVDTIHGDRDGGLDALGDRTFDAVIDTCGYVPRIVDAAARTLAGRVGHYTFISSLSVYENFMSANDEKATLATIEDETTETIDGDTYGALKALCERAADAAFPGGALHVRAGLIVGPNDPSDRFTYWPVRIERGGDVLAPGRRDALVQFIDVRDLSSWILRGIDSGLVGPFNVTGPSDPMTMEVFLETCRDTVNPDARLVWVPDATLEAHEVSPWTGLPLWIPGVDMADNIDRAKENRLWLRPLADTVRDTLMWAKARPEAGTFKHTLPGDREQAILASVAGSGGAP